MSRPKRRRRGQPTEVGSVLSGVLGDLGLESAQAALRVGEIWVEAVGPDVARHCHPVGMRAGVLDAAADSSVWCQQVQLRSSEILEALRERMGDDAPKELRLKLR